jgi:LAO/AO transport system kinase
MEKELISKILEGNVLAAARLMRRLEDESPDAIERLQSIYPHTGRAHVVGVTGAPGAGKSTMIDNLINNFRKENMTVGVIAIDPTSPFTGGAILGDRIRMQKHSTDKDVFIRSLAARHWVGGLSKAAISTIHVMDAMGKDVILIETVGTGQSEIDIAKVADTSIIVMTPGMGDAIQMMKAGILEAVDIFVINKADKEGTNNLKAELEIMLGMRPTTPGKWQPDIFLTEALSGKGIEELTKEIFRHKEFLISSGELQQRRKQRAKLELSKDIEDLLKDYIQHGLDKDDYLEKVVNNLAERKTNPHTAALDIIKHFNLYPAQEA